MNHSKLVNQIAEFSNCKRRKVGAMIITETGYMITGYNRVQDKEDLEVCQRCPREGREPGAWDYRDTCPAIHAEQDAIMKAARLGHRLDGAKIYVNAQPCTFCNMFIKAAGMKVEVVSKETEQDKPVESWEDFLDITTQIFISKNKDYGNRYTKALIEYGRVIWAWEVDKKLDRIRTWINKGELLVKTEGLNNAVQDLFNYTVLYTLWLDAVALHVDPYSLLTADNFVNKANGRPAQAWITYLLKNGRISQDEQSLLRILLQFMGFTSNY